MSSMPSTSTEISINDIDLQHRNVLGTKDDGYTLEKHDIVNRIQRQFACDGFVCLRNVFKPSCVQRWRIQTSIVTENVARSSCQETTNDRNIGPVCKKLNHTQVFQSIFETLHKVGHTPFPEHCRPILQCSDRMDHRDVEREKQENDKECETNENESKTPKYKYALGLGIKNGFREIVMRSPGRYEISLLHLNQDSSEESRGYHETLHPLSFLEDIKEYLFFVPDLLRQDEIKITSNSTSLTWDDVQICNISLVVSTPGAPEQSWHADGGHVNLQKHLPCHVLNIFLPLVSVTEELGPTELRPGTHYHTRNLTKFMLAAKARKTLRPTVAPTMDIGDVLLFDYRLLHRGKGNCTLDANNVNNYRTFLVITVAQKWFKDVLNFPSRSIHQK